MRFPQKFSDGRRFVLEATVLLLASPAAPAGAQSAPAATASDEAPRIYTPADFARFAPRNALDMLKQVPGFVIDIGDTARRGLGQATANILINGERFSSKSADVRTELGRISIANVTRIEIVDGASLDVPGLSGQVANIVTTSRGLRGNFAWRPLYRPKTGQLRFTSGEVSVSRSTTAGDYTFSLTNDASRFGSLGPEIVITPNGAIIDVRDEFARGKVDAPRLKASFHRAFGDGSILNLSGLGGLYLYDWYETSFRSGAGQPDRERLSVERKHGWNYELGGDYEFAAGPGRLKLIGLRRLDHMPFVATVTVDYPDGRPGDGDRFLQLTDEAETIGRAEYRWNGGGADWQVSAEGALNRLDIANGLLELDRGGKFVPIPSSATAATVREQRAEMALSYGRPLSPTLTFQASLGAEYSRLGQTGRGGLTRTFYRPKGFVSLAWKPEANLDLSARIEREVGQLNFLDFVTSSDINGGTSNAGNANLVPPQSWNGELRGTRGFGAWGTATARLYAKLISDIVDIVPIGTDGQSPGNLDRATILGVRWTSTFNFDPLGWKGAKLDLNLQFQKTELKDPLTGLGRPISDTLRRQIGINFRQDIPRTDWAWGGSFTETRNAFGFRLDQISRTIAPGSIGVFVENKDVYGAAVRFGIDNVFGVRENFARIFYDGRRTGGIIFTEDRFRSTGRFFALTISGAL